MRKASTSVTIEITCIVILAAITGVVWNHELLHRAWTGNIAVSAPDPGGNAPAAAIPLPVGLMQVKDFFDRKEAVIIDARDEAHYTQGHIAGAISVPAGKAETMLPGFKKQVRADSLLIAYCNGYSCHDSSDLGRKLIAAGYSAVYIFEGGYPEWQDAGYPVEAGSK